MSNRTKQRRCSGLTLMLYQRTLHPELFKLHATDQVSRRMYEADVWIVDGGHVITFSSGKNTLTEVIVNAAPALTDRGLIQTIPCRGERYHEMTAGNIKYMISTQEEQLTQTLYDASRAEIRQYAMKRELMLADVPLSADGNSGGFLSVLDIERRSHELLVQSFHLFDDSLMVMKTQGIFEVARG
jgi:hypothetical protein